MISFLGDGSIILQLVHFSVVVVLYKIFLCLAREKKFMVFILFYFTERDGIILFPCDIQMSHPSSSF